MFFFSQSSSVFRAVVGKQRLRYQDELSSLKGFPRFQASYYYLSGFAFAYITTDLKRNLFKVVPTLVTLKLINFAREGLTLCLL